MNNTNTNNNNNNQAIMMNPFGVEHFSEFKKKNMEKNVGHLRPKVKHLLRRNGSSIILRNSDKFCRQPAWQVLAFEQREYHLRTDDRQMLPVSTRMFSRGRTLDISRPNAHQWSRDVHE